MNDLDTSIPDWIIDYPQTAEVFDALRLDASCQGKSLEYVCREHDLYPEMVLQRLMNAIAGPDASRCSGATRGPARTSSTKPNPHVEATGDS
jgi:regulator of cell morphogenesis and NO signaling